MHEDIHDILQHAGVQKLFTIFDARLKALRSIPMVGVCIVAKGVIPADNIITQMDILRAAGFEKVDEYPWDPVAPATRKQLDFLDSLIASLARLLNKPEEGYYNAVLKRVVEKYGVSEFRLLSSEELSELLDPLMQKRTELEKAAWQAEREQQQAQHAATLEDY